MPNLWKSVFSATNSGKHFISQMSPSHWHWAGVLWCFDDTAVLTCCWVAYPEWFQTQVSMLKVSDKYCKVNLYVNWPVPSPVHFYIAYLILCSQHCEMEINAPVGKRFRQYDFAHGKWEQKEQVIYWKPNEHHSLVVRTRWYDGQFLLIKCCLPDLCFHC